jgi:hypothetical protein
MELLAWFLNQDPVLIIMVNGRMRAAGSAGPVCHHVKIMAKEETGMLENYKHK